ncbi:MULTISPECIES: hypothetical protein [Gluconacetobacter]|nr:MULTISPECIES: hypothetical protein [Gluconacetobacter]
MDTMTQGFLYILIPAAVLTVCLGLAIGPLADRLAKYRKALR